MCHPGDSVRPGGIKIGSRRGSCNSPHTAGEQRIAMDFSLSTEQRELKEAAVAFTRATLNQDLAEREESGELPGRPSRRKGTDGKQEYAMRMYSYSNSEKPPRPNRISAYVFNLAGGKGAGAYFQGVPSFAGAGVSSQSQFRSTSRSPADAVGETALAGLAIWSHRAAGPPRSRCR
jgi:hypothetical protein